MNIVICDTTQKDREACKEKVLKAAKKYKVPVDIELMTSSNQFLFEYEDSSKKADLVYLDIPFAGEDGIKVAQTLREREMQADQADIVRADIVFWTKERSRVFEAFDVDALHYLIKEESSDAKFEEVFKKAARRAAKRNTEMITLTCAGEHRQIAISDIKYFEVQNRIITVHYREKSFEFYSTLGKIEEALAGKGFERVHKSFLVAKKFIQETNRNQLTLLDGQTLPVSRQYFYHREKAEGQGKTA